MTNSACSYCGRKGILIYPVRYAIACPNGKDEVPGLSGNFKIVGGPSDILPAKYTLRALRTGYLYVYEEKRKRLKAYIVLPNGALWEFPVKYIPTIDPERMDFCCVDRTSVAHSYCVDVEPFACEMLGNIWLGWSNVLWTKSNISKVSDSDWRRKHMQRIDTQAMLTGTASHAAKFNDYSNKIPHFLSDEAALKRAFDFSNAPVQRESNMRIDQNDMGKVLQEKCLYGGFIVAVNDPVGICSDLSELTLPTEDAGFDEKLYWGKTSSDLLDAIKAAVSKDAEEKELKRKNFEKNASVNPLLSTYARWGRSISNRKYNSKAKDGANLKPADPWKEFIAPGGKPIIDIEARERFSVKYNAAIQAFQPIATRLDNLHAEWLRSEQLSSWMQGVHDCSDIRSGVCYRESLAQCINKSTGNPNCANLLKRWLGEENPSNEKNLFSRALLFNQKEIVDATEPYLKRSDMPLEGVFNLYKRAVDLVSKDGVLNSFDRLALVTANILVSGLSRTASVIARNMTLVGLSLTGEVILRPSSANVVEVQEWILRECRKAGVQFDESLERNQVAAHGAAKAALEEYRNNAASVAIEIDMERLHGQGIIRPDAVGVVKIPGVEQAKRWISSDAPLEFKLGVVTIILQTVALSFATQDLLGNDGANRFETRWKVTFGSVTLLSSISETAMATLAARSEHPLSIFIARHWGSSVAHASSYAVLARAAGLIAGVAIACLDIAKGLVLLGEKSYAKGGFYTILGATTLALSGLVFVGAIACWWLLVAAVIFSLVSPFLNEASLQQWVSRSFFGVGSNKFSDLDSELSAYKSAIGG